MSVFIGVLRLLASSALSLGHIKQKQTQGTHHHVISWVSKFLAILPSFLYLAKSS